MKHIIFLSSVILLFACNSSESTDTLTLNNGKKWQVNAEMKPFIEEASKMVDNHIAVDDPNFLSLAERLKEQNSQLISSCTMKGKSHDELHKWLHPHLDLVAELEKAESEDAANEIIKQLVTSFETYKTYFE